MRRLRILVLFNEPVLSPLHHDAESEREILLVSETVGKILDQGGFEVTHLGVARDPMPLLRELQTGRPDAVFNLFEGLPLDGQSEARLASLLEWQGIAFTGSPAQALLLARNKPLTKHLLQGAELPTPEFQTIERLPLSRLPQHWPVIVKPGLQDASAGIDQDSVVQNAEQLQKRVEYVLDSYGPPVLVERYIPGREFNVSVVETETGPRVLPLAEIRFAPTDDSAWPILTYDAKWRPETPEYQATPPYFPQELGSALKDELSDLALRSFQLLGCRDYARVDFRVSPSEKPYILEVNPNPCINPDAGLAAAVRASGQTYAQFVLGVAHAAWRAGLRSPLTSRRDASHDCSI